VRQQQACRVRPLGRGTVSSERSLPGSMGRRSGGGNGSDKDKDDFVTLFWTLDQSWSAASRGSTALMFEFALYVHTLFYLVLQNFNIYGTVTPSTDSRQPSSNVRSHYERHFSPPPSRKHCGRRCSRHTRSVGPPMTPSVAEHGLLPLGPAPLRRLRPREAFPLCLLPICGYLVEAGEEQWRRCALGL
jgi:hypothetical protein